MEYKQIRDKRENDTNELFKSLGVFWAFSKEQFEQNKTPLTEGEKYADIGMGGFIPKNNVDKLIGGMKQLGV